MTGPTRTYRALLVANSTFPIDPHNLPELEGPRNDPVLLRGALCHEEIGLFPADNVRLVTERTMAEVLAEVEDFLRSASRQDTVLLYYSGHGMLDQSGELFLCTRDSRTDRLRSTAVKASDLRAMMDESSAAATVVVLDCCHSGRFKGGDVPSALAGRGRFVMTSTRSGELANDAHVRNHASLFTHHLAAGMLHGARDHDGDGVVTLSELYDYVHTALADEGRQVPQKRFEGDGDVAVALRRRSRDRPAAAQAPEPDPALIAPALADPVLDLSETSIDLGEVGADEVLPPERVAVVNRGGGSLEWTAESSAGWLRVEAEEGAVVLHLHPASGPNRANVHVRDARTGAIRTLRVKVRVRPAPAATTPPAPSPERPPPAAPPEAAPAPAPAPTPAAPTTPATTTPATTTSVSTPAPAPAAEPRPSPEGPPADAGWREVPAVGIAVAVASVAAGVVQFATSNDVVAFAQETSGIDVSLRSLEWGAGLLPALVGGLALALIGLLTLVPRLRVPLTAAALGLALPASLVQLGHRAAIQNDCQCVAAEFPWLGRSWLLALGAAAVAAVALHRGGSWRSTAWAPWWLVGATVAAALLWSLSSFVDPYVIGGYRYGSAFTKDGTMAGTWHLLGAVTVAALAYAGLRWLPPAAGAGLVAGAAVVPLLAVVAELAYLDGGREAPESASSLLLVVVPALAVVGLGVTAAVVARRGAPAR